MAWLLEQYGGANPVVLETVLAQVFELGAQLAVIEYRYLDADYRDEHSRFYSKAFRRYPSIAHRLHFFLDAPPEELESQEVPMRFDGLEYLGYVVLRPVPGAPVGRSLIRPPGALDRHISCQAEDTVNLFGTQLTVRGCPFIAQDAQLSVCAHASLWVTAYYHHLSFKRPRLLPGDIAEAVPSELGLGRPTPSAGLSIYQMAETATRIGLPALVYDVDTLHEEDESIFSVACRYLNSRMPVIVAGGGHAFVLVGYRRNRDQSGNQRIDFIRQDDERGPYQIVESPFLDDYNPWEYLIVPLPEKAYLSGEKAEIVGSERLRFSLRESPAQASQDLLAELEAKHALTFRSTLLESNAFKLGFEERGVPSHVAARYQRLPLSRWIWVVELTRRAERDRGEACVAAEAILDATDHLRDLRVLAWRIPDRFYAWDPDRDKVRSATIGEPLPLFQSVASADSEFV